jgi:hypothetical protein
MILLIVNMIHLKYENIIQVRVLAHKNNYNKNLVSSLVVCFMFLRRGTYACSQLFATSDIERNLVASQLQTMRLQANRLSRVCRVDIYFSLS